MFTTMKSRATVIAVVALVAVPVLGLASPAGAANNDNSKACQQGGFVNYATTSGAKFKNAGDCTSYAAKGGALVPLPDLVPDGSCTVTPSFVCTFTIRNIGIGPATNAAMAIRMDADVTNLTGGSRSASVAAGPCTGASGSASAFGNPLFAEGGCASVTVLPGNTAPVGVGVGTGGTGTVVVTVVVDAANTVLESNETNNTFTQTITLP